MLLSGMQQFPALLPPTVDHADDWLVVHNDEAQLAQEEAELEEKVSPFPVSLRLAQCHVLERVLLCRGCFWLLEGVL